MKVAPAFDYRPAPMHRESGKAMQMQAVLMNREERLYQCEALGGGLGVSVNELTAAGFHVHFDLSTSKIW